MQFLLLTLKFYLPLWCTRSPYGPSVTKGEKGIRCESGTMPVAVSPTPRRPQGSHIQGVLLIVFFATGKPGRHDERTSQKTCLCNLDFGLQDYGLNRNAFYGYYIGLA